MPETLAVGLHVKIETKTQSMAKQMSQAEMEIMARALGGGVSKKKKKG